MKKNVLITAGAGFTGFHPADELLRLKYAVTVLDNLSPQIHGNTSTPPADLKSQVQYIYGDICRNGPHRTGQGLTI